MRVTERPLFAFALFLTTVAIFQFVQTVAAQSAGEAGPKPTILEETAGKLPNPTGITQARFPLPTAQRDPLTSPLEMFTRVADYQKANPSATPPTARKLVTEDYCVESSRIDSFSVAHGDFEGAGFSVLVKVDGTEVIVLGSVTQLSAVHAQITGKPVIANRWKEQQ